MGVGMSESGQGCMCHVDLVHVVDLVDLVDLVYVADLVDLVGQPFP